jgi:hypothetical protein
MRAPMCTAMPPMSSRFSSISPVCNPLRGSMPSGLTLSVIAASQRMARAGPSKVVRKPSAQVFHLAAPEPRQLLAHHLIVPVEQRAPLPVATAARRVESTMSVNSTVANTRSGSA